MNTLTEQLSIFAGCAEAPLPAKGEALLHQRRNRDASRVAAAPAQTATPNLGDYQIVLINSSAGKDSQAMLTYLVELADEQRVPRNRLVVVYANLGRVVHPGTLELARTQAETYGLRFEVVQRDEDLLDQIVTRHERLRAKGDTTTPAWPSSTARYCTSDHKTSQVTKLMTRLVDDVRAAGHGGRVRVLNCLGIRAAESHARAKKIPFGPDPANWTVTPIEAHEATKTRPARAGRDGVPHGKRAVDRWLPIFAWSDADVWATIRRSGLPYHPAYDAGMPRLSCAFCVLAGRRELVLAARLNPELAQQYLDVERTVGHTFRKDLSMADVVGEATALGSLVVNT